jgi:hypothetical protein
LTWTVWGALVALNFLATGASKPRTQAYGLFVAIMGDRYYFEIAFLTATFAAVALHHARAGEHFESLGRSQQRLGVFLLLVVTGVAAERAQAGTVQLSGTYYHWHAQARAFLEALRADLDALRDHAGGREPRLQLEDGPLPEYLGLGWLGYRHEALLRIAGVDAVVVPRRRARYRITQSGSIARVGGRSSERRKARTAQ